MSVLGTWWTPEGLAAAQAALLAQATSVDSAAQGCATLPDTTKQGWTAFYAQLKTFCQTQFGWVTTTNPDGSWSWGGGTGETADQLQSYQAQLAQWQTTLSASCSIGIPVVQPSTSGIDPQLVTIVKYAAVGGAFLASAYVVAKITGAITDVRAAGAYREDIRDRRRARKALRMRHA
jgi:hypothetical protein